MALIIKNAEVEKLAAPVAGLTGENKTVAVRRALSERKERLAGQPLIFIGDDFPATDTQSASAQQ